MSIKVLVADDSITIQKVIGIIFGSDEYSLTVVDNGKAAVDKAREIDPDILLIDALMPGMTGYEVAEMVRSTPSLAAKPILILTGSFEPFDEEKAKRCGADDFIAKPFESQQIISKVKELLELGRSRALSAQVSPSQPAPETVREQVSEEVSAPIFERSAPVSIQQSETAQPADDIWGAFTPEAEPPFEAVAAPVVAAHSSAPVEPDVFAIVTEENNAQLGQSATSPDTSPQHTGTQWIPVEENTFEFEEDVIAEPPQTASAAQAAPAHEVPFGGISFEDDVTPPRPPVFPAAPEPESVLAAEMAPPAAITSSVSLTEEQLRAAILGASRAVIERIVWEVVPDLAEVLIRDAIRKIKEGA
ncbi:MAG: response regulator [Desulfuromonadaceae bacterium]